LPTTSRSSSITQHAHVVHRFDGIEHLAVRLPYFTDLLARQVEKILRDAAAEQHAQRQVSGIGHFCPFGFDECVGSNYR